MAAPPPDSSSRAVDRLRDCPSLLRVFVRRLGHSNVAHYSGLEGTPVTAGDAGVVELSIYVWSGAWQVAACGGVATWRARALLLWPRHPAAREPVGRAPLPLPRGMPTPLPHACPR